MEYFEEVYEVNQVEELDEMAEVERMKYGEDMEWVMKLKLKRQQICEKMCFIACRGGLLCG